MQSVPRYTIRKKLDEMKVDIPLVILGEPYGDSIRTLRPLGPRVEVTALARVSTPLRSWARASTPNLSSYKAHMMLASCVGGDELVVGLEASGATEAVTWQHCAAIETMKEALPCEQNAAAAG